MKKYLLVVLGAMVLAACGNDTDKIGRASTVFHMLGKNDRIEVEGFDDPDVQGIACYISYAKKGGLKKQSIWKKMPAMHRFPACKVRKSSVITSLKF